MENFNSGNNYFRREPASGFYGGNDLANNGHSAQAASSRTIPAFVHSEFPYKVPANRILSELPVEDLSRILPSLEPVILSRRADVREYYDGSYYIYFIVSAVVSRMSVLRDGSSTEVGIIGNEGIVGLSFIFNSQTPEHWARVVVPGSALRLRAETLRGEFERGGALQRLLLNYAGYYLEQVSQRVVCNSQHRIEERFASWLLMMHDRLKDGPMPLTQEQIACRLGTRRSSITVAAIALQEQRIISYSRGRIRILDRPALEAAACECYEVINKNGKAAIQV